MAAAPGHTGAEIAIVGMACRVPGARSIDRLWANLREGVSGIRAYSEAELVAAGVDPALLADPRYVRAGGPLEGVEEFDSSFFGYLARDAAIMDPQHRHFLECCWEAVEHAGHAVSRFRGSVGVFAGCGMNAYFMHNIAANPELLRTHGLFYLRHAGNDRDFLPTAVSYRMNLRGPSVAIQTACSSSLVAVHVACQSLLSSECDMALAGGVTIIVPHRHGYLYRENEVQSPDGACRAFDAAAAGTVLTSGAGVVVLRRLEDALRDGDRVHAVIRASAVNNDGSGKVGYLAPSVDGHAAVVAEALALADLSADDISYVEAHGTGTPVGDSIELAALTQAFRRTSTRTGYCRIGSVKPSVGHLDTAAGVLSLIKATLALQHRAIPASLNCRTPNPAMELATSPFTVNTALTEWTGAAPRRAGVSSLGVGGTNAHVILEEAPAPAPAAPPDPFEVLVISAKTPAALEAATRNLADHLASNPGLSLADAAFTLRIGRESFEHRRAVVCRDAAEAVDLLRSRDAARVFTGAAGPGGGPEQPASCTSVTEAIGAAQRWVAGGTFARERAGARRQRVPLPTYPFERQRFWIDPPSAARTGTEARPGLARRERVADWFSRPMWEPAGLETAEAPPIDKPTLIFLDAAGLGTQIASRLRASGTDVVTVREGDAFYKLGDSEYALAPELGRDGFDRLFADLASRGRAPGRIVHAWLVTPDESFRPGSSFFHRNQERGFYSLLFLAQALAAADLMRAVHIDVLTTDTQSVGGEPVRHPDKATVLGPVRVIPNEFPGVTCRAIDLVLPALVQRQFGAHAGESPLASLADDVLREPSAPGGDCVVAYRRGQRYRLVHRVPTPPTGAPPLRRGGTYLVTGGLGAIGLLIAENLAARFAANIVLVDRTGLPPREDWPRVLERLAQDDPTAALIRRVHAIEQSGGRVLAGVADVADIEAMQRVLDEARSLFGPIHGVFHAAGALDDAVIAAKSAEACERVFTPKVHGTRLLADLLRGQGLDFFALCSSTSAIVGPPGQTDYAAANAFLDAFASSTVARGLGRVVSIGWGPWRGVGMSGRIAARLRSEGRAQGHAARDHFLEAEAVGFSPAEGWEAFTLALAGGDGPVAVSTVDVGQLAPSRHGAGTPAERSARPHLRAAFQEPGDEVERSVAALYSEFLGIDRVGVNDSFFDLGGHSLTAVRVFARIKKQYGVEFPLATLFQAPTVAGIAERLRAAISRGSGAAASQPSFRHLVPMSTPESLANPPLFLVAGMFGNVLNLRHLAAHLGSDQPVYALQARGLYGEDKPHETFEEMARDYLAEVRKVQPRGPYLFGGFSGGGIAALEMARLVHADGERAPCVFMLDTLPPDLPTPTWSERLRFQAYWFRREGPRYLLTWARRRAAWEWGRIVGLFRRPIEPLTPAEFRSEEIRRAFERAMTRYRPPPFTGSVTLFRPRHDEALRLGPGRVMTPGKEFVDPQNFWGPRIGGRIDVHILPGDHDSMVLEPHVRILAARMKECIAAAIAAPAAPSREERQHAGAHA